MSEKPSEQAEDISDQYGSAWNHFWFAPRDAFPLAALRIAVGAIVLYWLIGWTPDLLPFFGPQGLVSVETVDQFSLEDSILPSYLSYLSWFHSPTELYVVHTVGIAVVLAFTLGLFTRISAVGALLVVMSYIHRLEFLTSQSDAVMVMLVFYLCLGPCGRCLSLDRWLANRKNRQTELSDITWTTSPSLRLIQCHLTLYYLLMLLGQLTSVYFSSPEIGITFPWLDGTAVWWLAARPDSRMFDLTGILGQSLILINAVTHLVMLFEIVLIPSLWNRKLRHYALLGTIPFWLLLASVSGLGVFAALMCAAGLAFVDPQRLRSMP